MTSNPIFWLLLVPMVSSVIVYVFGRLIAPDDDETANKTVWICVAAMVGTALALYFAAKTFFISGPISLTIAKISLTFDGISLLISMTVVLLGFAVSLFSSAYIASEAGEEKFYGLLMILVTSIIGLSMSTDLFNTYVWFELMALTTYALVAFYKEQSSSMEAGFKYLTQSAVGSSLIILGIAITFGATGEITFAAISKSAAAGSHALWAAGACFLIGYGIKCAFVPLHKWLPDAHSMAPTGISTMLSGIVIEAALIALLRSLCAISVASKAFGVCFLIFGFLNILIGNLSALNQRQIKRMLAYSSVAHMGYILLGVGFALTFAESAKAANGFFFHIFNHAAMKGLAFLAVGVLTYNLKITKGNHDPLMVEDMDGVAQKYPHIAIAASIAFLALGGLPPFSGFMSKMQIMLEGGASGNGWAIALAVFASLASVLSLGYYAPLVNRMYRHRPAEIVTQGVSKTPIPMSFSLIILMIFVIVFGFAPQLISVVTNGAAATFLALF